MKGIGIRNSSKFLLQFLSFVLFASLHSAHAQVNKYFELADRQILSRDYRKAIDHYFKGAITYPGRESDSGRQKTFIWDDIGYAYLQLDDYEKAVDNLNNDLSFHPLNYDTRFYLAVALLLSKDYDAAQMELKKIEDDIFFDERWIDAAVIFRKRNGRVLDRDELIRAKNEKGVFLERIDKDEVIVHMDAFNEKNEGAFHYIQGICFREIGELSKAEDKFCRAADLFYDEIEICLRLAELYLKQGRFDEAEVQWNRTRKLDEDNADVMELSKLVHDRSRPSTNVPIKIKIDIHHRLKDHTNTLLTEQLSLFFDVLKQGRILDSISVLEGALNIDERSFVVNHNLALTCYDIARMEDSITEHLAKAEYYCARAIWMKDFKYVSKKHEAGAHDLMGNIYFYQSRYDDAKKEFLESLAADPDNPIVRCNLGMAYYNLNDWVPAEEEWKRAIESEKSYTRPEAKGAKGKDDELQFVVTVLRKPISHQTHVYLGMLYQKQDLSEKAQEHYEKAVALEPENPEPYLELGKIYQMMEEIDRALECYQKYLYYGGINIEETEKLIAALKR